MSRTIITQEDIDKQREATCKLNASLYKIYNENPKVKELADQIHHSRMGAIPEACPQCIQFALNRLNAAPIATES